MTVETLETEYFNDNMSGDEMLVTLHEVAAVRKQFSPLEFREIRDQLKSFVAKRVISIFAVLSKTQKKLEILRQMH